jgi:hypothetical protein
MNKIQSILETLFNDLSDGLIHGTSPRATLLHARDLTRDAITLTDFENEQIHHRASDFILVTAPFPVYNVRHSDWFEAPSQEIIFIDGVPQKNKIHAIKAVRERNDDGLKVSYEYVKSLPRVYQEKK